MMCKTAHYILNSLVRKNKMFLEIYLTNIPLALEGMSTPMELKGCQEFSPECAAKLQMIQKMDIMKFNSVSKLLQHPIVQAAFDDEEDEVVVTQTYLDIGEDMNVPDDFTQSELQTGKWWRHLLAGGIAGAVSRTCTAPLDRLKVFLQVTPMKDTIGKCLSRMLKEGGVISMWRGNGINVIKIAPESAIKFSAYEHVKRQIVGDRINHPLEIHERFLAGASAGMISQTIIYPLEVLKTRLALRKTGQYSGILDAARKIYAREGLRCFYKGYIPNILGIAPYAGIDLAVYETLKKKYISIHQDNHGQPGMLLLLACGSVSCTLGQMCSYPLALIRTRLQAQEKAAKAAEGTMRGVFREIVQREGLRGLYRGITPNFIKVIPAVSISYVVYEYASRSLGVNMT